MNTLRRTPADEPVADAYLFDRRRRRAGGTEQYYGAYYADIIDDSDRYAVEPLVGIVLFVTILWFKQGATGFGELVASVRWWTLIPGLLGSFFVFASISGYQNVGAATTIAVLVASQLIGGLALDIARSHGVTLRAMVGPAFGALLLVIGAWLIAKRQF